MLKKLISHNIYIIVLFLFFFTPLSANNSILDKKVTLSANNITVIDVLHQIENLTDIVFSFKSDILNKGEIVSFDLKERSILEILNLIFQDKSILYKELGNQIILYTNKSNNLNTKVDSSINKPSKNIVPYKIEIINDTVYRYINTTNTKVFDTIRYVFFDTIRPKIVPEKRNISFEFGFSPYKNFPGIKPSSIIYEKYTEILKRSEENMVSFNIYTKFNKNIKKIKLSTGLIYSYEREKADYNINEAFTNTVKETFRRWITQLDTTYYMPAGAGEKPTKVEVYEKIPIDSTIEVLKTDTLNLNFSKTNKYHYMSFPITIGWEKQISEKLYLTLNTGPVIDILFSKYGYIFNPENDLLLEDLDTAPLIKLNLSLQLNTGIYYKINPKFAASFQCSYTNRLQSSYSSNFPFIKTNRLIAFSFGCIYFL